MKKTWLHLRNARDEWYEFCTSGAEIVAEGVSRRVTKARLMKLLSPAPVIEGMTVDFEILNGYNPAAKSFMYSVRWHDVSGVKEEKNRGGRRRNGRVRSVSASQPSSAKAKGLAPLPRKSPAAVRWVSVWLFHA